MKLAKVADLRLFRVLLPGLPRLACTALREIAA
jgi:hypothetical protein